MSDNDKPLVDTLAAFDALVMVCGRTGDSFTDFEEQAAAFHRETGKMRPGKDQPMEGPDIGGTREEYHDWVKTKVESARVALRLARSSS